MKVKDLVEKGLFTLVNNGGNGEATIAKCFCCDLLSLAMSKAQAETVWVTVMGNVNTLAVASLVEVSCIIFAEGVLLDENSLKKAVEHHITVFYTHLPIFETALMVHQLISETDL